MILEEEKDSFQQAAKCNMGLENGSTVGNVQPLDEEAISSSTNQSDVREDEKSNEAVKVITKQMSESSDPIGNVGSESREDDTEISKNMRKKERTDALTFAEQSANDGKDFDTSLSRSQMEQVSSLEKSSHNKKSDDKQAKDETGKYIQVNASKYRPKYTK